MPLTFGPMRGKRIYQLLLNSERIEARVLGDLESAVDWQQVNPDKLKL